MDRLTTHTLLYDKEEDARTEIAERVGACLSSDELAAPDRRAAELLARALLEDAIERVRSALSEAVKHAKHLPRDLALKLAHDVDSVACPFLQATEVFSDGDWQQLLLSISRDARLAVARRSQMSEPLAGMLAELGDSAVVETLIENPHAPMTEHVCHRVMDRFTAEILILDKLALRDDLIAQIAIKLTDKVSATVRQKLMNRYKLSGRGEKLADDAETGAVLQIVRKTPEKDLIEIAKALMKQKKLTPALLQKALSENQTNFIEAGFSVLSGRSVEHVRSVILRAGPDAVDQLFIKADIPIEERQPFEQGFAAIRAKSHLNEGQIEETG
jgi:uncharacterized protein (DUF2336 family)